MRGTAGSRGGRRGGPGSRGAGRPLRAPGRTNYAGLLVGSQRTVALLPEEPAGTIATRTAGAIEFQATLTWRSREEVPDKPVLPETLLGAGRCQVAETGGPKTRCLVGEIRSFSQQELGSALEAVLRSLTAVAGLTEAMLEARAVRSVPPRVASPRALEELARDLWSEGFAVRFGPSWAAAPEADVYAGSDSDLQEFLRSHPSWSIA